MIAITTSNSISVKPDLTELLQNDIIPLIFIFSHHFLQIFVLFLCLFNLGNYFGPREHEKSLQDFSKYFQAVLKHDLSENSIEP